MNYSEYLHTDLTDAVIRAFYKVYNELGFGFLERVYQNALYLELKEIGLFVDAQKEIEVYYKNCVVEEHELQLINYLKAREIEIGLLLNFGKKPEVRRKAFSNSRKKIVPK